MQQFFSHQRSILFGGCVLFGLFLGLRWLGTPADPVIATPTSASNSSPSSGTTELVATVVVDVVGAVNSPGVVELPLGARVIDAIRAAGGVRGRQPPVVNLARRLVDGEQIVVGQGSLSAATAGKLNINQASASDLEALPGIGPVLAARIVEYRTAHGPFGKVADLDNVSGVGPSLMSDLESAVSVG